MSPIPVGLCKPNSVCAGRQTGCGGGDLCCDPTPEPQWDGPPRAPYLVLLPMGFTVPPAIALGAVGSYPTFSPLPGEPGGLFSVALAVDDALRHHLPRASRPEDGLRGIAPCGVRTFLPRQAGGDPPPSGIGEPSQTTGLPPAKQAAWPSGVDFGQAILKRAHSEYAV